MNDSLCAPGATNLSCSQSDIREIDTKSPCQEGSTEDRSGFR